jgi:hypothetical protein
MTPEDPRERYRRAEARLDQDIDWYVWEIFYAIRRDENVPNDVLGWLMRQCEYHPLPPDVALYIADRLEGKKPPGRPLTSLRGPFRRENPTRWFGPSTGVRALFARAEAAEKLLQEYADLREEHRRQRVKLNAPQAEAELARRHCVAPSTMHDKLIEARKVVE